jgi:hypothetical protein
MQISNKTREAALRNIDALLGRMVYFTSKSIPIKSDELARLAWSERFKVAQDIVEVEAPGAIQKRRRIFLPVYAGSIDAYSLRLADPEFLYVAFLPSAPLMLEYLIKDSGLRERMVGWFDNCDRMARRIPTAYQTLKSIMEMVTTPGQLTRMAPDLLRYLPSEYESRAAKQKRRSSIPNAWYSLDRAAVQDAIDLLGMCYLLDTVPGFYGVNYGIDNLASVTWAVKIPPERLSEFKREKSWVPV